MCRLRLSMAVCAAVCLSPANLFATLSYESIGAVHNEDFDTLASSGTGRLWANNSTLPNWYLYRIQSVESENPPVAITDYNAGDGSSPAEHFYSFGPNSGILETERALGAIGGVRLADFGGAGGFVSNGGVVGWVAFGVTNNTDSQLTRFTASFAGEQWRDSSTPPDTVQTMQFEYGFGASFDAVTSWTAPGGNFDWDAPVANENEIESPVDGNAEGRVDNRGGTVANLAWANGSTLWLRWTERNDSGLDHGLAIDDFSFSATSAAVPEPGAILFGGMICTVAAALIGIRRIVTSRRKCT